MPSKPRKSNPNPGKLTLDPKLLARLWEKVAKSQEGCWEWLGAKTRGYGTISYKGRTLVVSRLVLFQETGLEGIGMEACHTCDNPGCTNPTHLFWGTSLDNRRDASQKGRLNNNNGNKEKTSCSKGHPYTDENTRITKEGFRACRQCNRDRMKLRNRT